MEINKVNGRGSYKYETKKIVGKNSKKKSFIYPLSFLHNFPNIYTNINNSCCKSSAKSGLI
jgi:hypothetical protein